MKQTWYTTRIMEQKLRRKKGKMKTGTDRQNRRKGFIFTEKFLPDFLAICCVSGAYENRKIQVFCIFLHFCRKSGNPINPVRVELSCRSPSTANCRSRDRKQRMKSGAQRTKYESSRLKPQLRANKAHTKSLNSTAVGCYPLFELLEKISKGEADACKTGA